MKKLYPTQIKAYKNKRKLNILAVLLLCVSFYGYSQVSIPFTPRSSDVSGTSVYNVKGNFVIIGNTNLELADYADDVTDSNEMKYVDVDSNPSTLNSSEATLQLFLEDGTPADCSRIAYAGLYWTGRSAETEEFTVTKGGVTKTLNKRKATITGPNGVSTEITAQPDNINYPVGEFANMFIAYADVTSLVQQNGPGAYTVSDLALFEGLGGKTGYYGGWSMVVVYENSEMKRRNISVFDGYAYQSGFPSYSYISLDISNINTTPNGAVNTKFGIMAGEGDFSINFDYFEAYKGLAPDVSNNPIPFPDSKFQRLSHAGHGAGDVSNFFNSSIATEGNPRNPMLANNTGMDLATFYLPNNQNVLIDNQQPSVLFRYSALQDSYIIYNLTLAFLAPAPEIEAEVAITDINGSTPPAAGPTTVLPGQNITYKVDVKNFGEEGTEDTMLSIPLPYNTSFQSLSYGSYAPYSAASAPYYDAATNSILWDLANLPQATRTDKLLADLTFTVTATTDCSILAVDCADLISLNGTITGSGINSGEYFDKTLITGYDDSSPDCLFEPIPAPLEATIDAEAYIDANCGDVTARNYYFCNYSENTIPTSEISADFPIGTRFYNEFPLTASSIEYTASNPFPATMGETTYYAVPQEGVDCAIEFNLDVNMVDSVPTVSTDSPEYCLNETASPLTATPSDPSFTLFYYVDNNPSTPSQASITPATDVAGTFTYYVAEGPSADCISANRVPITVIVHDVLDITSNITDASCTPGNDGSIDITVSGGSGNYTYVWSTGDTTQDITGLPIGDYTVTVTDETTGCDTVSNFTIERDEDSLPTITAPASYALEGCDPSIISDLPFSNTPVSISLDQLQNAQGGGGMATGFINITYADITTGTCPTVVTRTFTVVNDCNNTATATQSITIEDTTAPIAPNNIPADVTIECSDPLPVAPTLTTTDNCTASGPITGVVSETTDNSDPCNVIVTRTWTFTDTCGNASDVSQTITIVDTTAPELTGNPIDLILECDGLEKNSLLEEWLNIHANMQATDNCGEVTWTNDYDEDNVTDCSSLLPVTFTATDNCGNAVSFTANYEIRDVTGPDVIDATDATFECGDDAGLQNWLDSNGGATATDTCSEDIDWSNNFTSLSDECGNTGSATVTFSAADSCGNITTTTATVTITDTTAPTVPTAPADLTVECLDDVPAPGELTATDTCSDDITVTGVDTVDNTNPCNIIVTRTWTFADACGNTSSVSQTINVNDTTAPTAPDVPDAITVECIDNVPATIALTATDNCGETITATGVDTVDNSDACNVIVTRTWTFADACGNTTEATQTINVIDTTAPVAPAAPADITIDCLDSLPAPVELTATDNCGEVVTAIGVDDIVPGDSCSQTVIRTWTFTDTCGNTSTTSQTITVDDDVPPVVISPAEDIVYYCTGEERNPATIEAWVTIYGGSLVEDNCSDITWTNNYDPNIVACGQPIEVIFTATDACGNSTSTSATYTIIDETGPEINIEAQDITVDCSSTNDSDVQNWLANNGGATASDICSDTLTWSNDFDANSINGACGPDNAITVTFTASDNCGNTSTSTATITVIDTTAPTAPTAPADVTVQCSDDVPAMIDLTATDNCGQDITATGVDSINDVDACNVIITRTWTFTDACGNTSETSQIITVQDTTAPVVDNAPADVTVECSDDLPTMEDLTATDNCSGTITASGVETTDNTDPTNVVIIRTWTFTDDCGNTSEATQTITVADDEAPIVDNTPEDLTLECLDDVPPLTDLTATDNCSGTITAQGTETVENISDCHVIITRNWEFVDGSGNITSISQTITVNDDIAPVPDSTPEDLTLECTDDLPTMEDLTATDNCSGTITASGVETIDNTDACNVIITRTWTFTDTCGNTSEATQTINVIDETAPEITSPAEDIVYYCTGEERNPATIEAWVTIFGGALAEDNCSDVTWTNNYDPTLVNCGEPIEVIFTATDACGNASTTSATYTIIDETAPEIETEATDITFDCDATAGDDLNNWLNSNGGATATDICSDTLTWGNDFDATSLDGACGADNAILVTFTATDNCGNVAQTQATITILDEVAPELPTTIPSDVTVSCIEDVPAMVDLTATDVCAGDITATGVDSVNDADPTNVIITRTWTFTDDCGNTSEATQTIIVKDEEAPVVDNAPTDLTLECISDVPALSSLTATDNCAGTLTAEGTETIENITECNVIITRNWEFVDNSGNSTSITQVITVNDDTAPVVDNTPEDLTLECIEDIPSLDSLTATDNCAGTLTAEGTETTDNSNPNVTIITRAWTFTDTCGNTTEVSQTITVQDTTAPVVDNAPEDVTVACIDDVPTLTDLTATDNCAGTITTSGTETIDDADSCNVTITRTWVFTDNAGNTTETTQLIMVIDDVAPTAPSAPADVTVECTDSIPDMIDLTATDNCGAEITATGVDTENNIDSCSTIITRTWTFTDSCGNASEVTQIITVADETAPQLDGNLDTEITVNCSEIPEKPELTFSDNCDTDVTVVYDEVNTATGADYENYQVIRDWTVSDSCGNTNVYTQTINVNVQQLPVQVSDTKCTEGGDIDLDSYLDNPNANGTWVVDSGNATVNGSIFDPLNVSVGLYVFTFTESDGCQNQTTVSLDINDDCVVPPCDPQISETITPNGDQYNEYFTVTGIESCGYGNIKVEIYNRWGALVFKSENYQNNWNGQNDKQAFGSSDHLPTGTYYYIVTFNNSGLSPKRGPIYLGTK